MGKIVEVIGMAAAYEGKQVLHDINVSIGDRDYLGIIGPNGGGKTTFVKCLLGIKNDFTGKVVFYRNGIPVENIKIGYLPQYTSIDKSFPISVKEVVLSGLNRQKLMFGTYSAIQKEKAENVISEMGLSGFSNHPIGELSGGQVQRALLGRAIVSDPELLILDEPSTYVDKFYEAKLYEILNEISHKCAIILVSHDIGTVLQNVKSIACINETLDYHPDTGITEEWIMRNFNCPIDLVGHGNLPHRILKNHH